MDGGVVLGSLLIGGAIVAVYGYQKCWFTKYNIAPVECGGSDGIAPPQNPYTGGQQPPTGTVSCVQNYEQIDSNSGIKSCCKQDGTCCARADDSKIWPNSGTQFCWPVLAPGTSLRSSQNPLLGTYASTNKEFTWNLRSDGRPVYVGLAAPRLHWTIPSTIAPGPWCDAYYEFYVIEQDGSLTYVIGNRYPGDTIKTTNGYIEIQSSGVILNRPIRGFMAKLWLIHGLCGFTTDSHNIMDFMEVRVL